MSATVVRALALLFVATAAGLSAEEPRRAAAAPPVTDAERERFLLEGTIERSEGLPEGVTGSVRATLSLDGLEHDVHIQDIDERKIQVTLTTGHEIDFRDSWRGNVAAYRLDRLLGLGMVPVTVERRFEQKPASFTWWVDDFLTNEAMRLRDKREAPDTAAWEGQMQAVRIFDQLIYNFDRNAGNLLVDERWRIWMIDHSRAFKTFKDLKAKKSLGRRCPRALLEALRRLDEPTLEASLKDVIDPHQIEGVLGRRDRIVRHFDEAIAKKGAAAVLYDLPARGAATAPAR